MSLVDKALSFPIPTLNHWGYWIILLAAISETFPVFGLLIPGQLIVVIGGFFVKLGILDIGDTIFIAATGAIIGDLIGYLLGKKYGYSVIKKYGKYVFLKKSQFDKIKKLINRHTGKTLILGRFNSLTRSFAPFVAGSSDIPFTKFLIYNIIGGISWATLFVFIGYAFGQSYETFSNYTGKYIFILAIICITIIYLYKTINKRHLK